MKKLYVTFVLFFLHLNFSKAQFYTQYFDGADTSASNSVLIEIDASTANSWQIGPPQKIIFNSAATQPNAIVTDTINTPPLSDTSRFIAKVWLGWSSWGVFALQWKQKLDMEPHLDGGIIEYSIDSGQTWVNVFNTPFVYNFYGFQPANQDTLIGGVYALSGVDSIWRDIWLCFDYSWLQQFTVNDTMLFRFSHISNSVINNHEGWLIDNLFAHITIHHTIKQRPQANYLNVYPNPSAGIVHIETEKLMDYHLIEKMELINSTGKVVDTWNNIPTKFWFDTSKYSDGIYQLKVKTNLKTESVSLVIN